jgi:non-ribosomal peptide synthetase component F
MPSTNREVTIWSSKKVVAESGLGQNPCSGWVETWSSISSTTLLHQLFETQVEHSPESIAIRTDQQCMSYRHVNEQANQMPITFISRA